MQYEQRIVCIVLLLGKAHGVGSEHVHCAFVGKAHRVGSDMCTQVLMDSKPAVIPQLLACLTSHDSAPLRAAACGTQDS